MITRYGELDTAWLRVLFRLWTARRENERFNLEQMSHSGEWISGGYLPNYVLCSPLIGGLEGTRRVRNLHDDYLIPIDYKRHKYEWQGKTKTAHIYRIDCDPALIDFQQVMELRSEYRFPVHLLDPPKIEPPVEPGQISLLGDLFNNVIKENKHAITQEWELD